MLNLLEKVREADGTIAVRMEASGSNYLFEFTAAIIKDGCGEFSIWLDDNVVDIHTGRVKLSKEDMKSLELWLHTQIMEARGEKITYN